MMYMYLLSWLSFLVHMAGVTLAIGAGLFYLAELVEEYASAAKKVINYGNTIITLLTVGLIFLEELPLKLTVICIVCNLMYSLSMRSFPIIEIFSPTFVISFVLFLLHNYWAFNFFMDGDIYYPPSQILAYLTLFVWLVPLSLFVSVSANDNALPTHQPMAASSKSNEDVVSSYFKNKSRKLGLLSFLRYFQESCLPQIQGRKQF